VVAEARNFQHRPAESTVDLECHRSDSAAEAAAPVRQPPTGAGDEFAEGSRRTPDVGRTTAVDVGRRIGDADEDVATALRRHAGQQAAGRQAREQGKIAAVRGGISERSGSSRPP